ncbi:MAG: LemA family protein, partial [Desulfomonilaceae bacterium]
WILRRPNTKRIFFEKFLLTSKAPDHKSPQLKIVKHLTTDLTPCEDRFNLAIIRMNNFSNYHSKVNFDSRTATKDLTNDGLTCLSADRSKTISRLIEFCCSVLVAFIMLSMLSFLTLRPTLKEIRSEAREQWQGMVTLAQEQNDQVQGIVEVLKGFGVIQNKWGEKILEERSILLRAADPETIISSIDETNHRLSKLSQIAKSSPELKNHSGFSSQWSRIIAINRELKLRRMNYNETVKMYNSLLTPFPQNMLATIFGFVPLHRYPLNYGSLHGNA